MSDDKHEGYLRKNAALSRAYELDKKDKVQESFDKGSIKHVVMECSKCKKEKPTLKYRMAQTNRAEGAASFSYEDMLLCDDCSPKSKNKSPMNTQKINSMLKNAKRGRL